MKHHLNPRFIKTNANHLNEIALDFVKSDNKKNDKGHQQGAI